MSEATLTKDVTSDDTMETAAQASSAPPPPPPPPAPPKNLPLTSATVTSGAALRDVLRERRLNDDWTDNQDDDDDAADPSKKKRRRIPLVGYLSAASAANLPPPAAESAANPPPAEAEIGKQYHSNADVEPPRPPLRVVCISDTHGEHFDFFNGGSIPDGDILIHAGDFFDHVAYENMDQALKELNEFFSAVPHRHKVFVAGNHETCFHRYDTKYIQKRLQESGTHYLHDCSVEIEGIRIYGSAWNHCVGMGYGANAQERAAAWDRIPSRANNPKPVDIVVTHQPAFNILDLAHTNSAKSNFNVCSVCNKKHPRFAHWGDKNLRLALFERVRPFVFQSGHVHDDAGTIEMDGVLVVNAAMQLRRRAIVYDFVPPPPAVPTTTQAHGKHHDKQCVIC
ncbi:hypothetical protein CAOG_05080 [Capsaspora owczarzaki ATCC 30864]|uniref:Calcineurin-like phosphoesterase domain-containing protein n=1 Tax=Capsaspora owczarzaki (strain ATCC 30864) TaxID=595528 RepID=A0A0D2WSJ3_CAPO3|nr:hypothetical protein CAOG_05080 [Capsaspora owczarzaki ATCC 30864]KJE94438.1 hypothetical protein CAOG_005080 [Capsaspora owczarzaki ATCC 30864]|eukprot:XP_004346765.2 hypothetical protein CAOG_05080 [Capsaspora owczarzaki ATCC 30864]